MRRGRIFIYLALILLVALAGAFLFLRSRATPEETAAPAPALVDIVIAQQNIPQGAEITEDVLGKISLPEGTDFGVMFRYDQRNEQIVGKIAKYPIEQGVVITQPMIGNSGDIASTGPEWANLISPGMTAISIPTSRLSSVAYGVADGAHVNVIACFLFVDIDSGFQSKLPNRTAFVSQSGVPPEGAPSLSASVSAGQTGEASGAAQGRAELDPTFQQPIYIVPSEEQRPRPVCQTIFQDVTVLKLGDFPVDGQQATTTTDEDAPPPAPGEETSETTAAPDVVTLIVSPQDATSLTYMLFGGAKLTLTLRGASDISRVETEAATLQFLLSQYAIPVPAKLPYGAEPRIDSLLEPVLENDANPNGQ
ncbi:MAG: hypothetical protein HN736_01965 [Anaerolineae bacterium]|jgi:pilus assembly protein CpaB|nr:hypothetical protein [Anaerolineae bacterium]MBT3712947.1 hypothetical protein [Anaerolineae bacterium]MBT4309448.1 hypothetical protein [Anaerolineae bacterium]MBT4458276.1 hypothetical protein [Anaerolineae bacterium]MBT4840969.1 hypothetical protein [Anaerolineae bacterium]